MRDLLRKRLQLVRPRTAHILSFKSLVSRNLGITLPSNEIKGLREENVEDQLKEEHLIMSGKANLASILFFSERIKELEKAVLKRVQLRAEYKKLLTAPGMQKPIPLRASDWGQT